MAKNSISKISNAFSTGGGGVNFEQQRKFTSRQSI